MCLLFFTRLRWIHGINWLTVDGIWPRNMSFLHHVKNLHLQEDAFSLSWDSITLQTPGLYDDTEPTLVIKTTWISNIQSAFAFALCWLFLHADMLSWFMLSLRRYSFCFVLIELWRMFKVWDFIFFFQNPTLIYAQLCLWPVRTTPRSSCRLLTGVADSQNRCILASRDRSCDTLIANRWTLNSCHYVTSEINWLDQILLRVFTAKGVNKYALMTFPFYLFLLLLIWISLWGLLHEIHLNSRL